MTSWIGLIQVTWLGVENNTLSTTVIKIILWKDILRINYYVQFNPNDGTLWMSSQYPKLLLR